MMATSAGRRRWAARSAAVSPGMLLFPSILDLIFDVFSGVSKGEKFANRREMRRGPRGNPSLKAATQGEGGGRRRGAPPATPTTRKVRPRLITFDCFPDDFLGILGASSSHKPRKSTSIAPRPAP